MLLDYHLGLLGSLVLLFGSPVSAAITAENVTDVSDTAPELLESRAESPSMTDNAKFKASLLAGHNWYRSQHSAKALVWSDSRASTSAGLAKKCVFQHSGTAGVGENIALGYPNTAGVINGWGGERTKYNYANPGFTSATGHFTQVVWKGTTAVGCGRAKCSNGWIVFCQYSPPGNYVGATNFKNNVGSQTKGKATDQWTGQGYSAKRSRIFGASSFEEN